MLFLLFKTSKTKNSNGELDFNPYWTSVSIRLNSPTSEHIILEWCSTESNFGSIIMFVLNSRTTQIWTVARSGSIKNSPSFKSDINFTWLLVIIKKLNIYYIPTNQYLSRFNNKNEKQRNSIVGSISKLTRKI